MDKNRQSNSIDLATLSSPEFQDKAFIALCDGFCISCNPTAEPENNKCIHVNVYKLIVVDNINNDSCEKKQLN